jgi:hypothetical protein
MVPVMPNERQTLRNEPDVLAQLLRSGVTWVVVYREGLTAQEAGSYLYGNATLYDEMGGEGVYLAAMSSGPIVQEQCDRFASGLICTGTFSASGTAPDREQKALRAARDYALSCAQSIVNRRLRRTTNQKGS